MKAARDESRSSLLVYASEKAVSYEAGDLPQQLRVRLNTSLPIIVTLTEYRTLSARII